jgi:hypothetical protein
MHLLIPLLIWSQCLSTSALQMGISDSDTAYPYIAILDPPLNMDWDRGLGALGMAQASAVRINSKGIQFIPSSHIQLQLADRFETTCTRARHCMCVMNVSGIASDVFPEKGQKVYITSTTQNFLPVSTLCTSTNTGRTLLIADGNRMDISLCNIIDGNMDIVYIPSTNRIYITTTTIPTAVVVLMSLLVLYIAAIMCHNIEELLATPTKRLANTLYMDNVAVVSLLLLTMFCTGDSNIFQTFITLEDRLVFLLLIIYSFYYMIRSTYNTITTGITSNPVNSLLAVLTVVSMRIHMTLDNPYTVITTFLFCLRLINKVLSLQLSTKHYQATNTMDLIADSFVASTLIFLGVMPQFSQDPCAMSLSVLQGTSFAFVLNRFMNVLEFHTMST